MWAVKVLKRNDGGVDKWFVTGKEPHPIAIEWMPVDPDTPNYESYHNAKEAFNDYKQLHPHARVQIERTWVD